MKACGVFLVVLLVGVGVLCGKVEAATLVGHWDFEETEGLPKNWTGA